METIVSYIKLWFLKLSIQNSLWKIKSSSDTNEGKNCYHILVANWKNAYTDTLWRKVSDEQKGRKASTIKWANRKAFSEMNINLQWRWVYACNLDHCGGWLTTTVNPWWKRVHFLTLDNKIMYERREKELTWLNSFVQFYDEN
jgi:hypothetical protein